MKLVCYSKENNICNILRQRWIKVATEIFFKGTWGWNIPLESWSWLTAAPPFQGAADKGHLQMFIWLRQMLVCQLVLRTRQGFFKAVFTRNAKLYSWKSKLGLIFPHMYHASFSGFRNLLASRDKLWTSGSGTPQLKSKSALGKAGVLNKTS